MASSFRGSFETLIARVVCAGGGEEPHLPQQLWPTAAQRRAAEAHPKMSRASGRLRRLPTRSEMPESLLRRSTSRQSDTSSSEDRSLRNSPSWTLGLDVDHANDWEDDIDGLVQTLDSRIQAVQEDDNAGQAAAVPLTLRENWTPQRRDFAVPSCKLRKPRLPGKLKWLATWRREKRPIRVVVLVCLQGFLTACGQDGLRGFQLALSEFGGIICGRKVEYIVEGTSGGEPAIARRACEKAITTHSADIVLGPTSGDEGLEVKAVALANPQTTFVGGSSGAADMTARDGAKNLFRYNTDGAQWVSGLATFAYKEKGYRTVATVGEDYSFPYSQVASFALEFSRVGGRVLKRLWIPPDSTSYTELIDAIPSRVDAIFIALSGTDAAAFLSDYSAASGTAAILGGSCVMDRTILKSSNAVLDKIVGAVGAMPVADNIPTPEFRLFAEKFGRLFPDIKQPPGLFVWSYYVNAMALFLALEAVEADLSQGHEALHIALSTLVWMSPTGELQVDENRQSIGRTFIVECTESELGSKSIEVLQNGPRVTQTLGMSRKAYLELGSFTRDNPSFLCEIQEDELDAIPEDEENDAW